MSHLGLEPLRHIIIIFEDIIVLLFQCLYYILWIPDLGCRCQMSNQLMALFPLCYCYIVYITLYVHYKLITDIYIYYYHSFIDSWESKTKLIMIIHITHEVSEQFTALYSWYWNVGVPVWFHVGCFVTFYQFWIEKNQDNTMISIKLSTWECIFNYKQMYFKMHSYIQYASTYYYQVRFYMCVLFYLIA